MSANWSLEFVEGNGAMLNGGAPPFTEIEEKAVAESFTTTDRIRFFEGQSDVMATEVY